MAKLAMIEGGRRRPQLGLTLPEVGSPEFYLWVLIALEVGFLLWVRVAFKGAHGG
jgi:hypothetical protein